MPVDDQVGLPFFRLIKRFGSYIYIKKDDYCPTLLSFGRAHVDLVTSEVVVRLCVAQQDPASVFYVVSGLKAGQQMTVCSPG